MAKHKCREIFPCDKSVSMFAENDDAHIIHTGLIKVKTGEQIVEDTPEHESGKDSNSVSMDSDSATSVSDEAKTELEFVQACLYNRPSTSIDYGTGSFKDADYPLDSLTVMKDSSGKEALAFLQHDGGVQWPQHHDHLLEFGNEADYIKYAYGDVEQYTDKEVEDILYSNGMNPNMYVLSSGRWSVNQGN